MDFTNVVGIVAGICTGVSLLPQLIKLIRKKETEALSLAYLGVLLAGLGLWIWYGFLRNDIPLIATNAFSFALNAIIIVLSLRYRHAAKAQNLAQELKGISK